MMKNITVGWFEIPVADMERAMTFYEKVFDCKLERQPIGPLDMAWFPWDDSGKGAGGSLVKYDEFYKPSADGVQVYFSSEDVETEIHKVAAAGGKILSFKKEIAPGIGFMALFLDTEGNRIAVHSNK
jgi:predicted enzyme related to lactoylglutathione lyase